jgi:outer membrane protein
MKKVFTLVVAAAFILGFNNVSAQKIGVVSPDEIFGTMADTRKADSTLALYQTALGESYQAMQEELNSALEKFVRDSAKMGVPQREVKKKELQKRITEMQSKEQELTKDLEAEKEKTLKPIREKMLKAIKEVAKENGYTYVLYKEQTIVFPEADDFTDKVKAKLGIRNK